MTSLHTLPIPRASSPTTPHEHAWIVESRHRTSEGTLLYVRCADCGSRRLDVQAHPQQPPAALSREIGTPSVAGAPHA
ncbi:hypothetical protein KZC51_15780 [Microbacterium sp. SSW1-49]|uniref:RNHCP domain-containing protein n=1 Tax=Microbacterium croceum TaxID=2851645 RepID=A0ABT0FIJ5_9MICO|nr:hypothetical protein [Microbacterium croceum]MCK2037591.1 hypothetical protein [Microbacterium croceum]